VARCVLHQSIHQICKSIEIGLLGGTGGLFYILKGTTDTTTRPRSLAYHLLKYDKSSMCIVFVVLSSTWCTIFVLIYLYLRECDQCLFSTLIFSHHHSPARSTPRNDHRASP
jgi:hypothetical protein